MKILMMSNTYLPHVGGVAKSVESFTAEYRKRGHRVVLVVPEFDGMPGNEVDVIRVPAIQNFNGSDFSLQLPIPGLVASVLSTFQPDIIHAHHPFLLGDTALLIAASHGAPLVFTHHTMYEQYTHYVPGDSPALQQFVVELSTGYANLCNGVIAPSASVAKALVERGVVAPISVIPTGVEIENFVSGEGAAFRAAMNIPAEAFIVGHVGRLAPEKNLEFLSRAVIAFLKKSPQTHFLVVGIGPSQGKIKALFKRHGLTRRLHMGGVLSGRQLADAYHAMNVFVFASKSETQGMVLAEAMAAGVPVVALDAPGVREIVVNKHNGRLLPTENIEDFVSALSWVVSLPRDQSATMKGALKNTAENFSMSRCADRALSFYESLMPRKRGVRRIENSMWSKALRMIKTEWEIWANRAHAAGAIITKSTYKKSPR
jgi:glycosyltransferase involved in cell wall biosynthesis